MLVARGARRDALAIVQHQVQRHIRGGDGVLGDDFRQHQPRQRGIGIDGQVGGEQPRACGTARTGVVQRPQAAVAHPGLGRVRRAWSVAHRNPQRARSGSGRRRRLPGFERGLQALAGGGERRSGAGHGEGQGEEGVAGGGQGHARVSRKGRRQAGPASATTADSIAPAATGAAEEAMHVRRGTGHAIGWWIGTGPMLQQADPP